jgi:hypothetical protein
MTPRLLSAVGQGIWRIDTDHFWTYIRDHPLNPRSIFSDFQLCPLLN